MTNYSFVRSTDTWGVNSLPWQAARDAGINGLLINAEDPNLGQALVNAHSQGLKAGIWLPAASEAGDPNAYAQHLLDLVAKYGPDMIVPDIESAGKGYKGSPGWQWNQDVANALKGRLGNTPLAVSVMPNQDDFNYGAWTGLGAQVWAQVYGANDVTDRFNPVDVRARLRANGVPDDLINLTLAQGQDSNGAGGPFSYYTLDDMKPADFALAKKLNGQAPVVPAPSPFTGTGTQTSRPANGSSGSGSARDQLLQYILSQRKQAG